MSSENIGDVEESDEDTSDDDDDKSGYSPLVVEEDTEDGRDPRARVLSVLELEDLFIRVAPNLNGQCISSIDCAFTQ